jgi:ribosomal protein L24
MSQIIFCMKHSIDAQFTTASIKFLEFPVIYPQEPSEIFLTYKNDIVFEFNLTINGKNKLIKSIDDILSITLSQKYELNTQFDAIENSYEYWTNIMTKRLEEISHLRSDRYAMLENLDFGDKNDDVTIDDVNIITQKIKNHVLEINDICTTSHDVAYKKSLEIKHIDLVCGTLKRVKLKEKYIETKARIPKEELYDIVWFVQDYGNKLTDVSNSSRIEIISTKTSTINIPKIRPNNKEKCKYITNKINK